MPGGLPGGGGWAVLELTGALNNTNTRKSRLSFNDNIHILEHSVQVHNDILITNIK